MTQAGGDEVLAHSHSSREGLQSHAAHSCLRLFSGRSAAPLQCGALSAPFWDARFHLGSVKEAFFMLRRRGVASNSKGLIQPKADLAIIPPLDIINAVIQ